MDSLANYGSDDDYEESSSEKTGTSGPGGNRTHTPDVNYDEVQMDLSEESNNNNSAEDDDQKVDRPSDKRRSYRSRSREDPRPSKSSDSKSRDRKDDRRRDREDKYDRKYRDDRSSKSRKRRSTSKERKRSSSRDRKRSTSRERTRRSGSRERKRSGSKERRRSRSPRRDERRRRSSSKDRSSSNRYGKKFDRTCSKIAQLEKLGIEIKTPDSEYVTPQMLLQRSMDEQVQKVKHSTGIELPKYYNPAAMNPARYADQIQKRRLLWQKKEAPTSTQVKPATTTTGKVWEQTTFAQDSDGKVASKFKRLMGIKENPSTSTKDGSKDILKKQEEMFSSMEQQYEVARTATHTMRGVGLGFGTFNNYSR